MLDVEAGTQEQLLELIGLGGHVILPLAAAQMITGAESAEQALPLLSRLSDAQLVVTDGAHGSWAWVDGEIVYQAAFKTTVVDTTGCGDSYHGAYAFALLRGKNIVERMQFASAYASLVAQYVGGRTFHPSEQQVMQVIERNEQVK